MAIEGVNAAGAAYQGSSQKSAAEISAGAEVRSSEQAKSSAETLKSTDIKGSAEISVLKDGGSVKRKQELSIDDGKDAAENKLPSPTEALKKAVEEINKKATNSEAIFGIHDATNRVTIKIVDKNTREVLKEYPPEKTLDMIAKVWELAGLLVDEKG